MSSVEQSIFQNGSTTYYWSSRFFPAAIREDVFRFYSFVRVVDDYVDLPKPNKLAVSRLKKMWREHSADASFNTTQLGSDTIDERVIKNIVYIVQKYDCPEQWVEAFFDSMEMDIQQKQYRTLDDTLQYIYGSAEVIGLFMARIMNLPKDAVPAAQMQGRAMQYVNFIRDIQEDIELGRQYFPRSSMRPNGLVTIRQAEARKQPEAFNTWMHEQIALYKKWQEQANEGFRYIPRRLRIPLRAAVDMYTWTARQIEKDPQVVFSRKVKPSKWRVIRAVLWRIIWS